MRRRSGFRSRGCGRGCGRSGPRGGRCGRSGFRSRCGGLPVEGREVGRGLRVTPRGLAQGVNHEGCRHHHDAADDEHRVPDGAASRLNLGGRDEAQHEGEQRTAEAECPEQPHQAVAPAQTERARRVAELVAQHDGRREHQHVHDEVEQHGELRENLVEGLHRGHDDEEQRQQRDHAPLHEQDVALHADAVGLLEEGGQVARLAHGVDTLRGAGHPGEHAGQHAEHQRHGDDGRGPRHVQVAEVVVEADEQRLRQADVLGRDDEAQREGAQHEDADRDERADDDGARVVARRIAHLHHVDAHHLHAGVEEEDAAGEHQVVELRQVGEEALRHVHVVVAARGDVDDAQHDEQSGGDDGAYHAAPLADFAHPVEPLERDEGGQPVDGQHDDQREELVRGERHVVGLVDPDEGNRDRPEGEHRGVPDGRFNPLQPDGQKARPCAVGFAHPAEDAALLVGEHGGQLGGHERRGDEEDDGGKEVVEGRRGSVDRLGRESAQAYDRRHVHDGQRHDTQLEPRTRCFFCIHRVSVLL